MLFSVKDWQLRLQLKDTPSFTANERHADWKLKPLKKEMPSLNVTEQDTGNSRPFSCHCFFFSNIPSKTRCRANITTLDISVFLFHPCIVCTTCITLGLTRACSHANRVNWVNEHTFHVGHPGVFIDTGKAWMCHSKC